jgi:hypothetical protein
MGYGGETVNEFLSAAFSFPTLLFSAALAVVLFFWLLVLIGVAEHGTFDGDIEPSGIGAAGLGGVPVSVAASLLIAFAWFTSLTGSVLLRRSSLAGVPYALLACAVLAAAVLVAWWVTRRLARTLARLFPEERGPSRQDFVGMTCTVRTGRVDARFGQAEVAARDGSTAVVQVRALGAEGEEPLAAGSTGLLYAYDETGEFFWVAPFPQFGELPGAGSPSAA